jgi:hypothetical protein
LASRSVICLRAADESSILDSAVRRLEMIQGAYLQEWEIRV